MHQDVKLKVVVDTNIIISAFIVDHGPTAQLLQSWKEDQFTLTISRELLVEIEEVLKRQDLRVQYHFTSDRISDLLIALKTIAELVNPLPVHKLPFHCRDPKDDILLAAAFGGEVHYLITGDKDLLVLKEKAQLKGLHILSVKEFLSLL